MNTTGRATRYGRLSPTAAKLLGLGEVGEREFKQNAKAVGPGTLASLANWVALDSTREFASLLVGVEEVEDAQTGLVRGVPCGLPDGLARSIARIQDITSRTRPIPVDVFVVEEATAGDKPFLRIEVRPTMPPHFDDEGRRQTRQGASTRALTDEEMLRIYLDREAGSFAARFRATATELREAVGSIGSQVDQISEAIDQTIAKPILDLADASELATQAASSAEAAASIAGSDIDHLGHSVRRLDEMLDELRDDTPMALALRVHRVRREVWLAFAEDTWKRTSVRAEHLATCLKGILEQGISPDSSRNRWELEIWTELLDDRQEQRSSRGTLQWWESQVSGIESLVDNPKYSAPSFPDIRSELRDSDWAALDDPASLTRQFVAELDR